MRKSVVWQYWNWGYDEVENDIVPGETNNE